MPPDTQARVAVVAREAKRRRQPVQAAVVDAFALSRSAAANGSHTPRRRGLLDPVPNDEKHEPAQEEIERCTEP